MSLFQALLPGIAPTLAAELRPDDPHERVHRMLTALEAHVLQDKGTKYVILFDDFETCPTAPNAAAAVTPERQALLAAMHSVIEALTAMARNSSAQSVIVSSDGHISDFVAGSKRANQIQVMFEWLTPDEATRFVELFLENHGMSLPKHLIQRLTSATGRFPAHLRSVCEAVVEVLERTEGDDSTAVDEVHINRVLTTETSAIYAEQLMFLDAAIRPLKPEELQQVRVALELWVERSRHSGEEQTAIPLAGLPLFGDERAGLETLVRCNVLYKDHVTNSLKETSLAARAAMRTMLVQLPPWHKELLRAVVG